MIDIHCHFGGYMGHDPEEKAKYQKQSLQETIL